MLFLDDYKESFKRKKTYIYILDMDLNIYYLDLYSIFIDAMVYPVRSLK